MGRKKTIVRMPQVKTKRKDQTHSPKFYAVKNGRHGRAIYSTWSATIVNTRGVKNCKFKSFPTHEEALTWLGPGGPVVPVNTVHAEEEQMAENMIHVTPNAVYTDGGCADNGADTARAGIGVYLGPDHILNQSFVLPGTRQTNNRAELFAALMGVLSMDRDVVTTVFTDSQYTIGAAERWIQHGKPADYAQIDNFDLIHQLYVALTDRPLCNLQYVPGHDGITGNEAADTLATQAIVRSRKKRKM